MRLKPSLSCFALYVLVGCASQQANRVPPALPEAFDAASAQAIRWPTHEWYREFSSVELDVLVDSASKNNGDIAAAAARVMQANARARIAGAAIFPSVDAQGNANFLSGHSAQVGGHELDWSALLSASYEIDFWGKNKAAADSARFLAGASRAEQDTITLTTLAGVANGYFEVLGLRERLAIAEQNERAAKQLLGVVQARLDAGVATPVELATQTAALDTAELTIVELRRSAGEAQTVLALLLGRVPEKFELAGQALDSLSEPVVSPGLPSELLIRRPDIAQAEANLKSSHADLMVARAAMFPSLSLTGSAGVQNPALPATVLTIAGVGPSFGLGANLLQPIFDHGRLKAQRDEVEAKEQELLAAYRSAIVAALVDVENALAAIQHLEASRPFQVDNVAQSERAFEGAKLRYQAGSGDFLQLLDAQRTVCSARDQFVQYKLARLQALVSLAKALGGGWTQPSVDGSATHTKNGI